MRLSFFYSLLIVLVGSSTAFSESLKGKKILAVTGVGVVEVVPDKVSFSVGVQTESKKIKKAQAENAKKMQTIASILEKYGIPQKNLKTQSYNIFPIYDYQKNRSEWKGYAVSNKWNVQLIDITQLSSIIDELSENATYVQNIQYGIRDSKIPTQKALSQALTDAKEKAQFIAKKAGQKIKSIFVIQDGTDVTEYPIQPFASKMNSEAVSTPFREGIITIQVRTRVIFQLA